MSESLTKIISAWQLVAKRSLAHWRLLSSVVLGVILASAIMAGTVIYFDALREIALERTLAKYSAIELDILLKTEWGPTNLEEYQKVSGRVEEEVDRKIEWLLRDRYRAGKTGTFFLATPGNEDLAGEDNARTYFAFVPRLEEHTTLLPGGRLPGDGPVNAPGERLTIEAIIPSEAAEVSGVRVGDRLVAVPHWEDVIPYATVVVSGVFERKNPEDELWYLEREVLNAATGPSFRTVPFFVSERAFLEVLGPAFRRMDSTYVWLLAVEPERVTARNAAGTLAEIETMNAQLGAALAAFRQSSALDNALIEYDRRLFFSKLPMFVVLILIAVVVLYYVVTLSSLAVEQRRGEVALLRSRGASSAQILAVFVLEGATIASLAIVAGPLLAAAAISFVGLTPAFSDLSDSALLKVTISGGAYAMSALGGILSFVALIIPAVGASRIGVTRHRQELARPSTLPAFQRYYVDVFLLLFSIVLFRQLTEQGSVLANTLFGEVVVSQLLLALPGLLLVASAMVLLRLFPLAMSIASRALSRWIPAGLVIGLWQMARNPTHYARLSLLLILTAGLGIFASSFGATLERSFEERVLYRTGSDVRVDGVRPVSTARRTFSSSRVIPPSGHGLVEDYKRIPGVDLASPVLRASGQDLSKLFGANYTMFALDPDSFGEVAWFRDDFADRPMRSLLSALRHPNPPEGITLDVDARTIAVRLKADRPHPSVRVSVRIRDAQDSYSTYRLGHLSSGDWSVLETSLRVRSRSMPLELVAISVHETGGGRRLRPGSIILDDVWVTTKDGDTKIVDRFDSQSQWSLLKTTADAVSDVLSPSDVGLNGDGSLLFAWSEGSALTMRGIFHGPERSALPVLASTAFQRSTGHLRGEEFEVSVAGHRVPVKLVDTVDLFPTMTAFTSKYLIADLSSLIWYANLGANFRELKANEMWISTQTSGTERERLVHVLETDTSLSNSLVYNREERLAKARVDPLVGAGWRALLFIAFAAVLILSCLGFLVHAYVSFRSRELQFALLRTMGFSMRQLVTTVWLEQVLVIAAGMALGTWMGGRLGATIMPFLGHSDFGGQVVPPFAIQVNWGALLLTYAAMVFVFAVIILAVIWFIQKISLHRVLRIGEA